MTPQKGAGRKRKRHILKKRLHKRRTVSKSIPIKRKSKQRRRKQRKIKDIFN